MIDIEAVRHDTPGCADVKHFNNAGSSLPPQAVIDTQIGYLTREARIGGYEAADEASDRLAAVYQSLANVIGAEAEEIAMCESATRAWDMAFHSINFRPHDVVITSASEYVSNYVSFLHARDKLDLTIEVIPEFHPGDMDIDWLESRLTHGTPVRLIAVSHIPTQSGLVYPAAAIGRIARKHGVLFLLDACQSVGQLPVDVRAIQCDMLAATGRKFLRGPRGTGFLYVRRECLDCLDPPFVDLRSCEWIGPERYRLRDTAIRFEAWESNIAARLGLGVAADYLLAMGVGAVACRIRTLRQYLVESLSATAGVHVTEPHNSASGIVTFSMDKLPATSIMESLRAQRINTSVSRATSARIDFARRGLEEVVRVSVHYFNTTDEIDSLVDALCRDNRTS